MEARDLKKIAVYSLAAVLLGLSLVLIPLATIKTEYGYNATTQSFEERLKALEGIPDSSAPMYSDTSTYSVVNVEIFAISFMVALIAYLLLKRTQQHHYY
jgi:branched-subunit amino acid ABC-type transport system permease component